MTFAPRNNVCPACKGAGAFAATGEDCCMCYGGGAVVDLPETYIRKVGTRKFEFGYVRRSENFRKFPDIFMPMGIEISVAEAETARCNLEGATP